MNAVIHLLRRRIDIQLAMACGLAALIPFLIFYRTFERLFWFGDEWELLDQIQQHGFWNWVWTVFAENYVPLFKILWGGIVILGGGSHMTMLWMVWLSHAGCIAIFFLALRTSDFSRIGAAGTAIMAGVGWMNLETLGWTVQWSSILATGFSLAALWAFLATDSLTTRRPLLGIVSTALLCAAAAFSFSRGVLIGSVLACLALLPPLAPATSWPRRLLVAACVVAPFFWSAGQIIANSPGNHQHLGFQRIPEMATFGWAYYALNPVHGWFGFDSWGWRSCLLLGLPKICLVAWAIGASRGRMRMLLVALTLLDLGNAVLLGIGRYHTGIQSATGMRYQYASLFSTLPVFLYAAERIWTLFGPRSRWTSWILGAAVAAALGCAVADWRVQIAGWAHWRGDLTRQAVAPGSGAPPMGAIQGIDFMSTARARELVDQFGLH